MDRERVRLPATPVGREHQLYPRIFSNRMVAD